MGGTAGCRVTCLQPYSTFTIPAHPLGVNGRETAATVAAVRTVYPFLPVSESECRYFYRHISVSPNVLRNLGFSQKLHIFVFLSPSLPTDSFKSTIIFIDIYLFVFSTVYHSKLV